MNHSPIPPENRMRACCLLIGLVATSQVSLAAQLVKPVIDKTPSGIPRVMSPGPTAWRDTLGWKLVLDHTVQPPDGSPGELGQPMWIAALPDGRVVVQDESPTEIRVYDRLGKYVRTIGRIGAGPGEYRSPSIAVAHDRLVVHDPQLSRTTLYTLDGAVVRSFPSTTGSFGLLPFLDDHGRITQPSYTVISGKSQQQWVVFDTLGRRVDSLSLPAAMPAKRWTIQSGSGTTGYTIPFAAENRNSRLRDGTLVHGRTDQYQLMITRNGRDTVRIFGRTNVTAVPIPGNYRDSVYHAKVDRIERLRGLATESDVPTSFDLWGAVNADGAGNIWVSTGGGRSGPSRLDVFAPSGAFLGTVPSPWRTGERTSWAGDRVAVLDNDANDLPRVRVFRIVQTGGR